MIKMPGKTIADGNNNEEKCMESVVGNKDYSNPSLSGLISRLRDHVDTKPNMHQRTFDDNPVERGKCPEISSSSRRKRFQPRKITQDPGTVTSNKSKSLSGLLAYRYRTYRLKEKARQSRVKSSPVKRRLCTQQSSKRPANQIGAKIMSPSAWVEKLKAVCSTQVSTELTDLYGFEDDVHSPEYVTCMQRNKNMPIADKGTVINVP